MTTRVGLLHPGEMGSAVAASAKNRGMEVYWCADNRSTASQTRAQYLGLTRVETLQDLCDTCDILIAVCPPHAAMEMASAVIACQYKGLYADFNAIAPSTVKAMAAAFATAGTPFVDGGIVGLPPTQPGTTWLYLSGDNTNQVADCFSAGPLETIILGEEPGQASGLKMCFAANSKGTAAMHTAILGAAEAMGVRQALEKQWDTYNPGFTEKSQARIRQVARKAWRFTGEMEEIAQTLAENGMPADFHLGAAKVYARQAGFKDTPKEPTIEEVLAEMKKPVN